MALFRMTMNVRERKLYYWVAHKGSQKVVEVDLMADEASKWL